MKPLESIDLFPEFPEIQEARTGRELRNARIAGQDKLLEMKSDTDLDTWISWVNRMHDEIGQRAAVLCEEMMVEAGFGRPPVCYAFVAFGSAGRQEATLWSDQDNGLIVGDELEEGAEIYFEKFGSCLSDILEVAGYPKCTGKVMCSEPIWRLSLTAWKQQLSQWSSDHTWEPTRLFIIASDMRHIAGSRELSESWMAHYRSCVLQQPDIIPALLRNTVRHKATLNVMGRIVTERFGEHAGDFDVKYGLYIPLVNSIRTLALQRGITESSSIKRMEQIIFLEGGGLLLENVQHALKVALRMRMETPLHMKDGLIGSSGYMLKEQLKNKKVQYELRDTLGVVRRVHRSLQRELRFAERKGL
ncbi:DUF294 nucleotidyltransferase-like domain-containing protein [Paenibacillus sp. N3/727]|uniref:DUF294 nucleotidyltransferase-like domain-containing protein n=1 Tax=Paenibacillus sp. N3/727 TaxID=2925845 RepID=UPI001F534D30|nr:DUF294 nucleotidyltransferase-like domain-containing protein [Paenibacillus sp. N3/727]UNK17067.1 DUF294 nucleotidyltransferase-like domain-containing protein [Paenibacillus sp. N3/727]